MEKDKSALPVGFRDPWQLAGAAPETPLAVAFSGGADSVALLAMLAGRGNVSALHVHHGIRGAEADRDEAFCRETAAALGVPFTALHVDVPQLAARWHEGLETAARRARYGALSDWMRRHAVPLLATAHHADDQLETVLQNLVRGAGTRGLSGIPACRPLQGFGTVVRPLLAVPRREILSYLAARGLSFVEDSTNGEPCCLRNRLRAEVIPALAAVAPRAAAHAATTAAALAEDEAYFADLAAEFLRREGDAPSVASLVALPRPVRTRVWRALVPVCPTAAHLSALERLLSDPAPHKSLSLPTCRVAVEAGRVCVQAEVPLPAPDYAVPLSLGEHALAAIGGVAVVSAASAPASPPPANLYRYVTKASLSSAILEGELLARPRRPGDVILSGGMHKDVRKLPVWRAFPVEARARAPILADDAGVVAVPNGPTRDGGGKKDLFVFFYFN